MIGRGRWLRSLYEGKERDRFPVISSRVGHALDPALLWVYRFLFRNKIIHPNVLSLIGVAFGMASSFCIAMDRPLAGAVTLFISGMFDLMDGAVARTMNRMTIFGGFLDSVLDRYTDLFVTLGVFIHFARRGDTVFSAITFAAGIGIAVIPYAKARAEAASLNCNNGLLQRPERIILIVVALVFDLLRPVMIVLAVLTHVTVIQRILHVRKQTVANDGQRAMSKGKDIGR